MASMRLPPTDAWQMVQALKHRPDDGSDDSAAFDAWCAEAHDVANRLDPLQRPLRDVIGDFDGEGARQD